MSLVIVGIMNAYLNRLCALSSAVPPHYSLAYNLQDWIDPQQVKHSQQHHSPRYSPEAIRYRAEIVATNGENYTYHTGAYLGNGLYEGAISSALAVSQLLDGEIL